MAIIRRIEKIAIALIVLMESLRFAIYCGLKCSLTSVEFGADVFGMELASNIFCRWFIEVLLFVGVPILLAVLYYCLRRHKVVEDMFKSVNLRIVSVSLLTVSAFIFGKWVVYALSMMGMDLDGVSDAVGLSSGWGGVGVLWGVYAAVLWALLQGIVFKGKCGSNCVYVAVFIFVLNCLVFSRDQILSSPIEIRLPQNLFNVLNSSKGNELSVSWYIISDESNVVTYCASPVGVYWFDMQPALKIKGFDNSGSLTCVKERRYKSIGESGSHVTEWHRR